VRSRVGSRDITQQSPQQQRLEHNHIHQNNTPDLRHLFTGCNVFFLFLSTYNQGLDERPEEFQIRQCI
jgi:hypothetical protein